MRFLPWWVSASRTQRSLFARHRVRQPGHFSVAADEPAEWSVFDPDRLVGLILALVLANWR
jgi:hypothetical protein